VAVAMLLVGFGTANALKPSNAATTTSTYTTTITWDRGGDPVNCVVYSYQVMGVGTLTNGSTLNTESTGSILITDFLTTTTVGEQPGHTSSTSTTIIDSGGPAWNSTVCTWLPK
jgi:hypothetical protein